MYIALPLLKTLPTREYRNGLAEIIKLGAFRESVLFEKLEASAIPIMEREPTLLQQVSKNPPTSTPGDPTWPHPH